MNIGKSIKLALVHKGMRGKDLAERLGVTQTTVSLMQSRPTASGQMLINLACAFDMKVSDFVKLGEDE